MYDVVPEDGKILDPDHSAKVGLVPLLDLGEYGYFFECLLDEFLALLDYFDREELLAFVVVDLDDFAEGASVDGVDDLVAVGKVIANLILIEFTTLQSKLLFGWFFAAPVLPSGLG